MQMANTKKKTNAKKQNETKGEVERKEIIHQEETSLDIEKIKLELVKYMKSQVDYQVKQEIEKTNKKIIKMKNKSIHIRTIIIVLLIVLSGYLCFQLYETGYFNKYFAKETEIKEVDNAPSAPSKEEKEEEKKEEQKPSLEELKKQYAYLLNPINLSGNSNYLEEYYKGELTQELKLSIALANVKQSDIEFEDDMSFIEEKTLKNAYEAIFNDSYKGVSFLYNATSIKYSSTRNIYIAEGKLKISSNTIQKEIENIEEKDNQIILTTVEGYISEGKLFNKKTNEEIEKYDSKKSFNNYKDKLATVKYTFEKNNTSYKLIKIEA